DYYTVPYGYIGTYRPSNAALAPITRSRTIPTDGLHPLVRITQRCPERRKPGAPHVRLPWTPRVPLKRPPCRSSRCWRTRLAALTCCHSCINTQSRRPAVTVRSFSSTTPGMECCRPLQDLGSIGFERIR